MPRDLGKTPVSAIVAGGLIAMPVAVLPGHSVPTATATASRPAPRAKASPSAVPGLSISVTDGRTVVKPGDQLTYLVSVKDTLTLARGASEMDMITIKVPLGATRGEHYGVIWVQQAAYVRGANGFGVNERDRVGIRIYLAVGLGGAPPTVFFIASMTGSRSAKGQPSLVVHVDNTGGRAVDLDGTARLTDGPGNTSAGPFPSQQIITVAPDQSGNMSFALPKSLPSGPWQAKVSLVSGITTSVATGTVRFGALAAAGILLGPMAWGGIALGIIALSLGLAGILVRRHARGAISPSTRPSMAVTRCNAVSVTAEGCVTAYTTSLVTNSNEKKH
jgi:hypothetical protein